MALPIRTIALVIGAFTVLCLIQMFANKTPRVISKASAQYENEIRKRDAQLAATQKQLQDLANQLGGMAKIMNIQLSPTADAANTSIQVSNSIEEEKPPAMAEVKATIQVGNRDEERQNQLIPASNIQHGRSNEEKPHVPPLRYDRELHTGFGDRLSVYLNVAAAAAAVGADVYVWWFEGPKYSLSLSEIESFVIWPKNLHMLTKEQFDKETANFQDIQYNVEGVEKSLWAFDSVYTTAWKTFKLPDNLPPLTSLKFEEAFRQIASEFQLKNVKTDAFPKQKYAVLHVRGDDKLAPFEEFCTSEVLRKVGKLFPVVVITDDKETLTAILHNATSSQLKVVSLPEHIDSRNCVLHHSKNSRDCVSAMVQDFAAMLSASVIVQHSVRAWSSFSSTAALLREVPLLSTWRPPTDQGRSIYIGMLAGFDRKGGVPRELNSGNQPQGVQRFMERARARARNPHRPRPDWQPEGQPPPVEAPVVEDTVRFLMVLGPEGSSHSFVSAIFHNSSTKKLLEETEEGLDEHVQLQRSLYNFYGKAGLWDWPCKVDHRAPEEVFNAAVRSLHTMKRKVLAKLAQDRRRSPVAAQKAPMEVVIPLNSADEVSAGMGSYPNFNGPCRNLQYPDVDAAMMACQAAGVTCSLLVLLRDVQEVIHSTTVRRGFQEKHSQIKLMAGMVSLIHSQLESHLEHPHWCWEYGEPNTAPLADALGLGRGEVAGMYAGAFRRSVFSEHKRTQLYDGLHQAEFSALRHAALKVRQLCGLPGEAFA